ncbi:DMT family transporter [Stenotrophomonas maltophilia]|uniref:DMT family transporter n=1 Tax=Stenotrophomonas maltophilia TaxID=40324 RepID=UPI003CCFED60
MHGSNTSGVRASAQCCLTLPSRGTSKGYRPWPPLMSNVSGIAFYFLSLVLKSIPVGVAYAVWSGLGVVIITAIAWLLHGQKLDAWGFVGMGLIIAAFLLARSPSWKSLRRPTPW